MQQSRSRPDCTQRPVNITAGTVGELLYEPLDSFMIRAPLLPIEAYLSLDDSMCACATTGASSLPLSFKNGSLLPHDPRIVRALAVGSSALLEDLERTSPSSKDAEHLKGKLLRFLIRMSTRPTPYGLFAGVALGQWGQESDLALSAEPPHSRTRPDMAWLLAIVRHLEALPDILHHLCLVANPTAFVRGDRVFMTERTTIGDANTTPSVSVRATGAVKKTLVLARQPIPYEILVDTLLTSTPAATREKVERLLAELLEQTVLLTELRPPLTINSPARYVMQRLSAIPSAGETLLRLQSTLQAATQFDTLPPEDATAAYRALVTQAYEVNKAAATPVQVDMALALQGQRLAQSIGAEIARAAELLLRVTPFPTGTPYFEAYRRAFLSRYGHDREVPLLELLDPNFGLGSPAMFTGGSSGIPQTKANLRAQTLLHLAYDALHAQKQVIELDSATIERLETWTPSPDALPLSLDLNAFVAAYSLAAIDAGQYHIIIGPNLGAQAAGRNLGRFADMLGSAAEHALRSAAQAEEARTPGKLWAELVYVPRNLRSANVVIHPATRSHEIVIGTSPGVDTQKVIRLDELAVGVRNNRFYVRWLPENTDIIISSGHMLNTMQAPIVCRFLAEVSRDGIAQLSFFDWGPASGFPFLPRVQVGRIVLRQAEWHIDTLTRMLALPPDSAVTFKDALTRWRERWRVPRYVYLSFSDNRLLLDLESKYQVEELRTEIKHLRDGGLLVLQEVYPDLDQVWLQGPEGHYMAELSASLVIRPGLLQREKKPEISSATSSNDNPSTTLPAPNVSAADRLRPPGSDWLFVKLYCTSNVEEDLLANPLRAFAEEALSLGLADEWFFIRYNDPDLHIRLRFRGEPERLLSQLLPKLCQWAADLMANDFCSRFVFDTYDREIERYGGPSGTQIAESIFAADSHTVTELLQLLQEHALHLDRTTLGVLTVDNLLSSLAFSDTARLQWLKRHVTSRNEVGQEYRQKKILLRSLLQNPQRLLDEPGGNVVSQLFTTQRTVLAPISRRLWALSEKGELGQTVDTLCSSYIHLHCNRLFGSNRSAEGRVLGLLLRTREGLKASNAKE